MRDEKMKGKVMKWVDFKGFGFIKADGKKDLVFVHHSNLSNTSYLKKGENVEFKIVESTKGPQAVNVILIDSD